MSKWISIIKQKGESCDCGYTNCDYTIGCGVKVTEVEAATLEEAKNLIIQETNMHEYQSGDAKCYFREALLYWNIYEIRAEVDMFPTLKAWEQNSNKEIIQSFKNDMHAINIRTAFSSFSDISHIYTQPYLEELRVFVILKLHEYDGELLEALLTKEYEFKKGHPTFSFSFQFLPANSKVSPQATLIFKA